MKILVDAAMPYWQEYFADYTDVQAFTAGTINEYELSKVNVLLVRSTTKVNQALLNKMPELEFVGTATAGYDHFDIEAIEKRGIKWTAAGGCNAQAVCQYVLCALLNLACDDSFLLSEKRIAVVGHGNVGSKVAACLRKWGADVLIYDPPQQRDFKEQPVSTNSVQYCSFEDVLASDIICIHSPFNSDVEFPSKHMFNKSVLARLHAKQYLINAGRGELIDNAALLNIKQQDAYNSVNLVLDVWENEPNINRDLIQYCRYSSAHIAGHTLEGKAAGTDILYKKLKYHLKQAAKLDLSDFLPPFHLELPEALQNQLMSKTYFDEKEGQFIVKQLCTCIYDIKNDDRVFRRYMAQSTSFAKLRQQYPVRREFSALKVKTSQKSIAKLLAALGFCVSNSSSSSSY
ncbi:4-phosphoerythronate dehydrogenase [Glaciecola sp. 2405UD65-10]|uniref:4-phosphoerythronate dehydrogenase n=1 Tax=Glaciecola sp. 2405UD65-10 TaxID=3397244 RepID=UPI003B59F836